MLDQQPVVAVKPHRRGVGGAPGWGGDEVQQVAAHGQTVCGRARLLLFQTHSRILLRGSRIKTTHDATPLRFFHRGQITEVNGLPTTTVLQYLREHARAAPAPGRLRRGGDCGACTVLQAELDVDGQLRLSNVNACTQFLPTLDGRARC